MSEFSPLEVYVSTLEARLDRAAEDSDHRVSFAVDEITRLTDFLGQIVSMLDEMDNGNIDEASTLAGDLCFDPLVDLLTDVTELDARARLLVKTHERAMRNVVANQNLVDEIFRRDPEDYDDEYVEN